MYYIYLPKIFEDFLPFAYFSTNFLNVTRDGLRFSSFSMGIAIRLKDLKH